MIIKELRYDDGEGGRTLSADDGWLILLQSSDMGEYPCYVASKGRTNIAISERAVLFIEEDVGGGQS